MKQRSMPLFDKLIQFSESSPVSFHVPGHKNGEIIPDRAKKYLQEIMAIDMTELTGLDDLHAPHGVIAEAQSLAADYFGADHTYFLVGGSTAGNLAMILSVCTSGDEVIVQRNAHKSIFNGLELSGASPVFIAPEFDETANRYTAPALQSVKKAIETYPDAKALILTYPDYFGTTYDIKTMIELAHAYNIPVLVDEAHGVHFSVSDQLPESALELGADVVVHSAHKMAPAMTMASYLHWKDGLVSRESLSHYLQMVQSSSPSYPLMASLDIARQFLATMKTEEVNKILVSVEQVSHILQATDYWEIHPSNDPLKITLQMKKGKSAKATADFFEEEGIHPELVTYKQLLLVHGLAPFKNTSRLKKAVKHVNERLKNTVNHATIEEGSLFPEPIQQLAHSYQEMRRRSTINLPIHQASGHVAAEAVIPYPPGIPLILKGERITETHIEMIGQLMQQGVTIQHDNIHDGIRVFK
ncbi:aminotransferase class I/II-fold pyridoxal phosphate-dependent enzyme [Virgibacillus kekensis]|uniref:Aminotransferase class I/II-fold pyridoxal phosphate-dependent enzyme n=1 Tax=Virgibacillus kekensis TaxID=202261 RepID=A0ABV9DI85_9BACI